MKKKTFIVQLLDSKKPNRKSFTQVEDANFYSNDTDASLVFIPHEDTFDFESAKVVMYNRGDESLVERDMVVAIEDGRKVASYEMPDEIIAHWGDWTAQPVFINGGEIYSGSIVPFSVFRYLMHDRPPRLNEVVTITNFIQQSQALVDDMAQKETQRVTQEQARQSAEAVRVQAEQERVQGYQGIQQILEVTESWNLFDKTKAMDKKLVSTNPDTTTIFDYPDAIYSNLIEVSEGDYVIYQKYRQVGEIFCYDNDKNSVTAINVLGAGYGNWPVPDGKITRDNLTSGDLYVTRIKIIDTNIKYIAWHMHSGSYWSHTPQQFQDLIDSAQVSKGLSVRGYTEFGWENYKITKDALPELSENSITKPISVYKSGNQISIRTDFGDKDIAHLWKYPIENNNEGLNLIAIYTYNKEDPDDSLTGEMFKNSSDDIAPLHINGSYVGGNHGYFDLITLTASNHGKTTADIGSVWTLSGQAENYIIVDVVNADRIKIFSDFTGVQTRPTHYWDNTNGTLTHLEGATNAGTITFTQAIKEQLYPGANNKVVRFILDGEEITEDGLFYGDKFKIEEGYTITDIPSIQAMMKNSKGVKVDLSSNDIPGMVRVVNIFNHNINGSLTIQSSFRFLKQTSIAFYGAIQSMAIGGKAYIPDVGVINGLDLSKVVTQGTSTLNFDKSSWLDPDKPPFRYHQFNDDLSKGMAIGYNTGFGVAKPDIRKNTSSAGNFMGSSKKMYPYVKAGGTVTEGEYHQVISFRVPLRQIDTDATDIYWYWIGDDVYLAFDFHKTISKSISVPDYFIGKKIETIDIHENTKVYSDFVSVDGIAIEVLNGYGYGVIKLYD